MLRILLKIILFPVTLFISTFISFLQYLITLSTIALVFLSFVVLVSAIAAFFSEEKKLGFQMLVLAFLLSPFGLPRASLFITLKLDSFNDFLKSI